jgi:hypothetical protein
MTAGTIRFFIVVALVGAGLVVAVSGFSGGAVESATGRHSTPPSPSSSPTPARSRSPKPPVRAEKPKEITFVILNGTTATGLAGQYQTKLEGDGFTVAHIAANAPSQDVQKTIVYFRGGDQAEQYQADASFVAKQYFPDAAVRQLSPADAGSSLVDNAKVVIVIGADTASSG